MYNFDEIYPREEYNSVKYDLRESIFGDKNILPMWVADMDFRTPDFIMEAIRQRTNHEILGYTLRSEKFFESIVHWMQIKHQWTIKKEWISFSPGVVPALAMIVLAFTNPGDKIIVQPPVYFPFFDTVKNHGRQLVYNQLNYSANKYTFDFDGLIKLIDSRTRMILISSPHNPVGRVWKKEELEELAEICLKHNILLVSDEIHSDIMFQGYKHTPLASINEKIAENTIITNAPSKTFNLAGLSTSYVIISNQKLKNRYDNFLFDMHLNGGNIFGNIALETAYNKGNDWLNEMTGYVEKNISLVRQFAHKHSDRMELTEPEASYLLWLNFSKLRMSDPDLREFMIKKAGLGLNPGTQFGPGGEGFQRMNVACQSSLVIEALEKLGKAFEQL
jgi:cystathionine beta-lyase